MKRFIVPILGIVICSFLLIGCCTTTPKEFHVSIEPTEPITKSIPTQTDPSASESLSPKYLNYQIEYANGYTADITKEISLPNSGEDHVYSVTITQGITDETYQINVLKTPYGNVKITVFDGSDSKLQLIEAEQIFSFDIIDFADINYDGYPDLLLNCGGTRNEEHKLYVWNPEVLQFDDVVCEQPIYYFELQDGLILNWAKESASKVIYQTFTWSNENTLILISEEELILDH